jgi:uncharacterized protein YndB with AHSA1/START domain
MTTSSSSNTVHVEADTAQGSILAIVELSCRPERVFRALASEEITAWWVRPGVFETREWAGDVRVGGAWRASGVGRAGPFAFDGEFLEVEAPNRLVHSWQRSGAPVAPTTVSYFLQSVDGGTRLTLRHSGFTTPETCEATADAWRTSLDGLAELLSSTHG